METLRSKLGALDDYLSSNSGFREALNKHLLNLKLEDIPPEKLEMSRGKGMGKKETLVIVRGVDWEIPEEELDHLGYPIYYNDELFVYHLYHGSGVGFDEQGNLYFPEAVFKELISANKKPAL